MRPRHGFNGAWACTTTTISCHLLEGGKGRKVVCGKWWPSISPKGTMIADDLAYASSLRQTLDAMLMHRLFHFILRLVGKEH